MERKTKLRRFTERKINKALFNIKIQNLYFFLRSAEELGQSETRVAPSVSIYFNFLLFFKIS